MTEQGVLRLSILVTFLLAAADIAFGLLSGSYAIIFDGVYSLTDASMTIVALLVANLISVSAKSGPSDSKLIERFTMGFWHLEPMVLGLNGTLLMSAAVYALINAIGSFMAGGRDLQFGPAIIFSALMLIITLAMGVYNTRANRTINSAFVALDAKSWLMSGALTAALLLAFLFGYAIQDTSLAWMSPYIDPTVLALVCLVIIPIPARTVKRALADILLVTPSDLKHHVDAVSQEVVDRYGFESYRAYVARVGRGRQIELYFIVPQHWPARRLEEWDDMREEIGAALGDPSPDRWLTIVFTTDPKWAD
ncbi:cation diffusion facilitator family transporter [Xanthobacter sp. TB0139]|uniref:cation diffusion facilitator family transporter n=1 Tax=Xanthobacter sp. TB0139 TaxID=3459178 RepID=UPI00403A62B4